MEASIPWPRLLAVIAFFYPKGERGRPPVGQERPVRMDFLQPWPGRHRRPPPRNKTQTRARERHPTRTGNPGYGGIPAHLGAARDSKLVHPGDGPAATVAARTKTAALLHVRELQVHPGGQELALGAGGRVTPSGENSLTSCEVQTPHRCSAIPSRARAPRYPLPPATANCYGPRMSAPFPRVFRVRQKFERPVVAEVAAVVREELTRIGIAGRVRPGQSVAITGGSRGITNIHLILRAAAEFFQTRQARPFIVAAMGSHGGGTADGQRAILESYGITEAFCGCPVRTSMETTIIDQTPEGVPVHFGCDAQAADHVLVVGRVKPHTELFGDHQSGLMKMLLIGLGKHAGAKIYHRAFVDYSLDQIVRSVGRRVIEKGRILAGLGIVENAYDETGLIRAVLPPELEAQDRELLALARQWLPRLPFDHADLLLIDELGKEISGCGMDTNVIGRKHHEHASAPDEFPKVKRIAIRSLTEQTHGNATGLGKSEFCLTRVVTAMDPRITYINVTTACFPQVGMIPPHYATDRELLAVALATIGLTEPPHAKFLWIRNTLHVAEVECGEAFLALARGRTDLEILTPPRELKFDAAGMLPRTMAELGCQQENHPGPF